MCPVESVLYCKMQLRKVPLRKIRHELWEFTSEYEEDFKHIMQEKDLFQIPFLHQSPQIGYRTTLVDYLKDYAAEKSLTHCCLHLAVYLMDVFMDKHNIVPKKLHLVSNVCLLIAAKFEEATNKIPLIQELNNTVGNCYTRNDYKALEIVVLDFFYYYVMFPTAAQYVHYFMKAIIAEGEFYPECYRQLFDNLQSVIRSYLNRIIDDVHFMQMFVPSLLAAGVIAASRKAVNLPCWNEQLERITGVNEEQVQEPLNALLRKGAFPCEKCKKLTE